MADISILQLPPTSYVQADDVTVVVQQGITKKVAASVFQGGITGPTGPAGPQGPAGVAGPVGPQGPQGPQGVVGPTGPQGVPGQTGAPGPTGPIGPQGSVGQTGAPGPTGPSGPAGATGATGPKGDTGAQGPQGIQGPQGVKGDKGDTGNTGAAATIAVGTTTTSAPGGAAAVSNSGTSSAAVFDFTIPRGDTGPAGATGAGVATGGTTGQVLAKASNTNYDTSWINLVGGLNYQGNWNASANTPTLTSSVGTNGYYYTVSVAGSTNLNGITDWQVGDWAIFNGTVWQKIDQTNTVSSVNGQVGAVVLGYADVGAPSTSGTNATGTWGISVTGNAGTVTNGVYTTGSYADPSWLTSLATTKLSGTITNAQLANSAVTINGNSVSLGGSTTITAVNPFALTIGSNLSGTSYNGSAAVTITNTAPMVYPAAGIPRSTGSAWNTSYSTTGTGTAVALQTSPLLITPTLSGALVDNSAPYIDFTNGSAVTLAAGRMWYNGANGSWNLGMGGGNITQQVGEELFIYGKASAAIADSPLQIIYHTGTVGSSGVLTFAPTISGITDVNAIIGVATEHIATNAFGRITTYGVIHGITTNGTAFGETWHDDDPIWYNPVTGNPTNIEPVAPNIKVQVGLIISAGSGGSGSFQVLLRPGSVLGGTDSNVKFSALVNNNLIAYDSTLQYWKNVAPSTIAVGTATNLAGGAAGSIPYQTGSGATSMLATGTGVLVGGTTPSYSTAPSLTGTNFSGIPNGALSNSSITINGTAISLGGTVSVGTVTAVTGTSPVVSSGGTTPAISMPAATTSVSGYLTSTDWNTFNNKQPAGTYVNSVSGTTGRITSTGGSTPVIDLASGVATAGTTGSVTLIPVITIDTYGRVTSITTAANPQGTVTSVSGTGTVNGLTLTGTVTSSGSLTLGGTLDLSSPPAIGATAPNTIKGTTGTFTSGISGGTF